MAQKNKDSQPDQNSGRVPEKSVRGDEFDDAVTTEISDVLARAFDEDRSDPDDVYVTDAHLTAHVDPAADDVLAPGLLLNDRFEIVELVHSGGMSHVYKAVDLRRRPEGSGEIHVAIKMMRPAIASHEAARLALEREAAKAQNLSHPNIINIFDFDDHDGQFFLVMEWLEGESVNALLRRTSGERVASGLAATVIAGAAAGVQHAHAKDVVHADINPSNIFITDTGDIKLLDFGVARYTSSPEHSEDDRFAWVTQTYASPEVLSGLSPAFEDDVFSLACVAYRVLGGRHPFDGTLSLVAKHRGMTVEPIPGLPDDDWRILRSALAYDRADRPGDVGEFAAWGADAEQVGEAAGQRLSRLASAPWLPLAAVAAVIVLAGGLWLFQRGGDVETVSAVDPSVPGQTVADQPVETPAVSAAEMLLADAAQALDEGRLVEPGERDARTLFREALELEPGNVEAERGLRTISNDFVQKAHEALNANDPAQAYAALAAATETDSANPAIEIVDQLLVSKGDRELVAARLSAATRDFDQAAQQLSRAEQYSHIDPAAIRSVRQQIEQSRRRVRLSNSIAAVDAHIADGRLLSPEGNNAHALLLELYEQHGDDAQLRVSMDRLGERLLTRAAVAAADARVADATDMLDAVVALGVLAPEVEAVRSSLVTPAAEPAVEIETGDLQDLPVAEAQPDSSAEPEDAPFQPIVGESLVAAVAAEAMPEPQAFEAQADEGSSIASAVEPVTQAVPAAATTGAEPEPRRQTLQELGITNYVAPVFPRRAIRRRVTGMVEVGFVINADGSTDSIEVLQSRPGQLFSQSATNAVSQWRFEARSEAMPAQVTLRFETPD